MPKAHKPLANAVQDFIQNALGYLAESLSIAPGLPTVGGPGARSFVLALWVADPYASSML